MSSLKNGSDLYLIKILNELILVQMVQKEMFWISPLSMRQRWSSWLYRGVNSFEADGSKKEKRDNTRWQEGWPCYAHGTMFDTDTRTHEAEGLSRIRDDAVRDTAHESFGGMREGRRAVARRPDSHPTGRVQKHQSSVCSAGPMGASYVPPIADVDDDVSHTNRTFASR